jgi:hypothetical protein
MISSLYDHSTCKFDSEFKVLGALSEDHSAIETERTQAEADDFAKTWSSLTSLAIELLLSEKASFISG